MSDIKRPTLKEVYEKDSGNGQRAFAVIFTLPSSGQRLEVTTSLSAERVIDIANKHIDGDIKCSKAMKAYEPAVKALMDVALTQSGSGACAAAQVLLSTYNGQYFQVNAVDLCNLDSKNLDYAMAVLRGRVVCMTEPHSVLENGDELFRTLWDRWERFDVRNRYKDWFKSD